MSNADANADANANANADADAAAGVIAIALPVLSYRRAKNDIFLIFARRGGSYEYPQSMFRSNNKKNKYTPAYPSFTT